MRCPPRTAREAGAAGTSLGAEISGIISAPMATLNVIEKVLLLQDLEFFRLAESEHLAQLASICRVVDVEPGSVLFREGEPSKVLHLLVDGSVQLEVEGRVVGSADREALDHWSFFAEGAHLYSAKAAAECRLLAVDHEDVADLLTAEPEFCWAIARHLAKLGRREALRALASPAREV